MNLGKIALPPVMGKLCLRFKRNWPTIATVTGCVGVTAGTVLACRATLKVPRIMNDHKVVMDQINEDKYLEETEMKRSKTRVFVQTGSRLAKTYAPAVLIQAGSMGLIASSHVEMLGRQAALSAAYTSVVTAFDQYRERLRAQIGEDEERKAYLGLTEETVTREEINEETGRKKKVKEKILVYEVDPEDYSKYARCFCKLELTPDGEANMGSTEFTNDSATNLFFLKSTQGWANDKLHAEGWLSLNDVYSALGFDKIPEGQVIGWVDNAEHTKEIDFGIYNLGQRTNQKAINQPAGYAPAIMLDFNIDPVTLYDQELFFRS